MRKFITNSGTLKRDRSRRAAKIALSHADEVSWRARPWKWPRRAAPALRRSPHPVSRSWFPRIPL